MHTNCQTFNSVKNLYIKSLSQQGTNYMRIGFISNRDPNDIKSWSGTFYFLFNTLALRHEMSWVNAKDSIILQLYLKILYFFYKKVLKRNIAPEHTLFYSKVKALSLSRKLRKINFDYLFAPVGCQIFAFLKTNIPIIYLSDANFAAIKDYYPEYTGLPIWNAVHGNILENLALKKSWKIIFCSEWARQSALNSYHTSIRKTSVISLGANLPNTLLNSISKKRTKINSAINLLFLGVDYNRKGGSIAVKTVKEIINRGHICRLFIVGCSPVATECKNQDIEIIGFLNKHKPEEAEKLKKIIHNSDFLILPTRAECAGIVFCEASAFGLPIVTYDTGGISNYVENNINGYRLPMDADEIQFADKILELYQPDIYENLKRTSQLKYENELNWTVWLERFSDFINKNEME